VALVYELDMLEHLNIKDLFVNQIPAQTDYAQTSTAIFHSVTTEKRTCSASTLISTQYHVGETKKM